MKNKWKLGFFVLLGIDLLIVITIMFLVLTPAKKQDLSNKKESAGDYYVPFHVQSNKEDLNTLIHYYLNKQAGNTPVNYEVRLGNDVELAGKIPVFSEELNMMLTFE